MDIFFNNIKNATHEQLKDNIKSFYDYNKKNFLQTLDYFSNIKIIFSDSNNINSIYYSSILKNLNDNKNKDEINVKNLIFVNIINDNNYFINSLYFNTIKWIYLVFNYFININIVFVDFIPLNIIEIFKFFENTNVKFEIITNDKTNKHIIDIIEKFKNKNTNFNISMDQNFDSKLGIVDNIVEKNKDILFDDQITFFNYVSEINNNIDLTTEQLYFIDGLYYFFNLNHNSLDILWEISYEGQTCINLITNEGIRLSSRKINKKTM
jgi:hypothetical protein